MRSMARFFVWWSCIRDRMSLRARVASTLGLAPGTHLQVEIRRVELEVDLRVEFFDKSGVQHRILHGDRNGNPSNVEENPGKPAWN